MCHMCMPNHPSPSMGSFCFPPHSPLRASTPPPSPLTVMASFAFMLTIWAIWFQPETHHVPIEKVQTVIKCESEH